MKRLLLRAIRVWAGMALVRIGNDLLQPERERIEAEIACEQPYRVEMDIDGNPMLVPVTVEMMH